MLSEEGWTKSKNWARRVILLSIFASLIGATIAGGVSFAMVHAVWSDLERYYLSSYLWAASPSVLSSTGTYFFVVIGVPPDPNYLATPVDVVYRNGAFVLTSAARTLVATAGWERLYIVLLHGEAYWKLREVVYAGHSCSQVFLGFLLIRIFLLIC